MSEPGAPRREGPGRGNGRFAPALLHAAATLYYLQDATQAEVAAQLGISRATVSRVLSDARRLGIVRIEVIAPEQPHADLAATAAAALGLRKVYLSAELPTTDWESGLVGQTLAPAVSRALSDVGLVRGDVLVVSSGRSVYEVAKAALPHLPGVLVAPTVGGLDEPEPWYQTNEIVRRVAAQIGGQPHFLYAPAVPGPELYRTLRAEPSIRSVLQLWERARCALVGVGAPPLTRRSIGSFAPTGADALYQAVGDICARFYDRAGIPLAFPGSERLMSLELTALREIATSIAVAIGTEKVGGIVAGARAGFFTCLVTDPSTAALLIEVGKPAPAVSHNGRQLG